jgi:predicted nucleic acid-binding protein
VADSNVPLDLARGRDVVLDAMMLIREKLRGGKILIPPRVVREIAYLAEVADDAATSGAAIRFLRCHREWGCQWVNDVSVGADFVEDVARNLRAERLLPATEVNDSVILVEAAALQASLLLTNDAHLRGIDFLRLKFVMERFDLTPPAIATPAEIVKKFLR